MTTVTAQGGLAPFDDWIGRWDAQTPSEPSELRAWQLEQAWRIAENLARDNPFFRPRCVLPAGRDAADFRSLPVMTKADVVADCDLAPPYGSRTVAAPSELRHIVQTSGTSGRGTEVYALDAGDEAAIFRAEAVGFWWAGVRPGTRVLLTLPVSLAAAGQWYRGGLSLIGANVLCAGSYSTEAKAELLFRFRAEVVVGTPSYLQKLAAAAEVLGDLENLGVTSIIVAGEGYGLDWARRIERRWRGAVLYEQYGCTERIMAWACPRGVLGEDGLGVLHVPPELAYWEVLDIETHEPVSDGEYGELVSTPLRADASPLLRFATGDRVEYVAAGSCNCGRPLPGIRAGGVRRADAMLKIRGVNVWPEAFDAALFSVEGVVEYRGRVTCSDEGEAINIEIETAGNADEAETACSVREAVRLATGLRATVSVVSPGTIVGSVPPGFVKVSRWIDLRATTASRTDALAPVAGSKAGEP